VLEIRLGNIREIPHVVYQNGHVVDADGGKRSACAPENIRGGKVKRCEFYVDFVLLLQLQLQRRQALLIAGKQKNCTSCEAAQESDVREEGAEHR